MFNLIVRMFLDNVGGRLSLRDGSLLPRRCAVCNGSVDSPPIRKRISCSAVGSGYERVTIYLHLCGWHKSRRLLLLGVSAAAFVVFGLIAMGAKDGVKPTTMQFVAFVGVIVSGLILINLLFFDPFFRGLGVSGGAMEIKGFGKRFRESLGADEIRVISSEEFAGMRASAS